MEEEILKTLSKCTPCSLHTISNVYSILNRSFDKTLLALRAVNAGFDPEQIALGMHQALNAKIKLTFWQKLKKCWRILTNA